MPRTLRLTVSEFTGPTQWRWALTDAAGAPLADHQVQLNERDWHYEAAADLPRYLSWNVSPDEEHAPADEARIVGDVGGWLGAEVFGDAILAALVQRRPATVQVILPPGAEALAFLPLELASRNGTSLARHGVTLVIQTADGDTVPEQAAGAGEASQVNVNRDQLRVLGLFSLPEGGQPLNLRRERHELVRLVNQIAANGKAAEVRVLQYGVTRDRLRYVLEEAAGWDIIHVSGHGAPGELLLETADGRPDRITAAELADLLDTGREHVRLVTLAACWSASRTAAAQRRLLALPVPDDQPRNPGQNRHSERVFAASPAPAPPSALATELTSRLGCAVLAMRYPVDDDFAIALTGKFYDLLVRQRQEVPKAVYLTLKHLTNRSPSAPSGNAANTPADAQEFPALSLAAPALFGARAVGLTLAAPDRTGPASYSTDNLKLPSFPPQPERFVGRTKVMAQASEALAPGSRIPGVILHGMPGGGKTACALELAYTHEHAFEKLIRFKAPDESMAITGALTDFALTLERYLLGFQMAHVLVGERQLTDFLPLLTERLERSRILLVLDNAESLLTKSGQWRDQRWAKVFGALTGHAGLGRVILTTRHVPASVTDASAAASSQGSSPPDSPAHGLRVLPVDALSADEALLLARELPDLDRLIRGDLPGLDRATSRRLALGVLNTAQGHPKLLELANGQAAHPDQLKALIDSGDQAWREQGGLPDGFFTTGATGPAPGDYLHILSAWTNVVTGTLTPAERDLFWFLCCLEEPDRISPMVEISWTMLWHRLDRNDDPPALNQALGSLTARGIAEVRKETPGAYESYGIHPAVAAAGAKRADPAFRDSVDVVAADCWDSLCHHAAGVTGDDTIDTRLLVRAGVAAVPYLVRQQQWDRACFLLETALPLERSPANAAAVLPVAEALTRKCTRATTTLARVLAVLDPAVAEPRLRSAIDDHLAHRDYSSAATLTQDLVTVCISSGRLAEALRLNEQKADLDRRAGRGPWTLLGTEVSRLDILNKMGQARQVSFETERLLVRLRSLPDTHTHDETAFSWNVREMLYEVGRFAAIQLGMWPEALDFNVRLVTSMRARHALATEIARARANDYGPLIQLGGTDEALALLSQCLEVFRDARDFTHLGKTLSALANVEYQNGHDDTASRLQRDALRHSYQAGDVITIATGYHNLGIYLGRCASQPCTLFSDHLTSALIGVLTGSGDPGLPLSEVATGLRTFRTGAELPVDVADLCRKLGDIPGTDPAALIARLAPDSETAERTLRDLIAQAQELARQPKAEA